MKMNKIAVENHTQKCNKCLTCGSYMYGCAGVESEERANACTEYAHDKFAYIRQDRDETYSKPTKDLLDEYDRAVKQNNQYRTKTYIFDYNDDKVICVCYTTSIPNISEHIIVYQDDTFVNYVVKERVMGVNKELGVSVWNLYVIKE